MKKPVTRGEKAKHLTPKKLKRLLRALVRDQACLIYEEGERKELPEFGVFFYEEGRKRLIFRPDRALVKHCLGEDLLVKTPLGWSISANGRLALKRMLAGADPFAEQHQQRSIRSRKVADVDQQVVINDRASPLGWLARRFDASGQPMISKVQFAAGERLAQDFQFAGMMPRITATWGEGETPGRGRNAPGTGVLMSDNRLAAQQRVRRAIDEAGNDLADILLDICCFQLGLSEAEKARGWPRRSGKIILRIALDRLADHYGMANKERSPNEGGGSSQISHWGATGYKPS